MTRQWTATVVANPEDSESLLIQFPDNMMEELGWKPDDYIVWDIEDNGTITIKKKKESEDE
jgi:antitoxin component of MazEF toxin-antitoxin module